MTVAGVVQELLWYRKGTAAFITKNCRSTAQLCTNLRTARTKASKMLYRSPSAL